jgi:VanZ family protein
MATVTGETDSPAIRWTLWMLCVAVWTLMLVTPQPAKIMQDVLPAHVLSYAFLTVLAAWLRVRGDRRWLLLVFLSLHGMATEYVQTHVPGRSGSWRDVGIDHIGILLGLALSWRWWRG